MLFPTRSLFSAPCQLSSSTALQSDALSLCSSASQTHLHTALWVPAPALHCYHMLCVSPSTLIFNTCSTISVPLCTTMKLDFQLMPHDFPKNAIFPQKRYRKLTPVISALALFPTRSLFSAPCPIQLQHCAPVRCPSTAQLCLTHLHPCAVGSCSSSALPAHTQ